MKKLLAVIMFLGIIFNLSSITIFGATEVIDYTLTYTDNKEWDINNGNYLTNTNYMSSNRVRIREDMITLNNLYFSHILFWSDTVYLGYYNPSSGGYEGTKYLNDTTINVTPPANATWFSLTAYKQSPNEIPIVELNNHTLREVFELGNLFTNPNYNNSTIEFYSGAFEILQIVNNRLEILANNQWDVAYKYTTLQVGTKLYLRFDVENFNNTTYIMYNNGSNYLPTNTILDRKIQKGIVTINIANSSIQIADANTTFSMRYVYSNHAIDLTSLGISALTVTQMDTYFYKYQTDSVWSNGLTLLLFYSMEATYTREEVIPDNRTVIEKINDWLDDFGLGDYIKILISLVLMVSISIILFIMGVETFSILMVDMVLFVMFTVFGWYPIYLVIIVGLILLGVIYFMIKGGA
ncbi:MAG: hypothetical protein RBR02_10120 [Desulfuromonadaceae bacterium]|nr:hypothetical protein [Desulfuromonadaceae bacterium]